MELITDKYIQSETLEPIAGEAKDRFVTILKGREDSDYLLITHDAILYGFFSPGETIYHTYGKLVCGWNKGTIHFQAYTNKDKSRVAMFDFRGDNFKRHSEEFANTPLDNWEIDWFSQHIDGEADLKSHNKEEFSINSFTTTNKVKLLNLHKNNYTIPQLEL